MPRYSAWDDDNDDREWSNDESEEGSDEATDDDTATFPCPGCGRQVYEEADACPYCGEYLADADRAPAGKPWWIMLGTVLALVGLFSGLAITALVWWWS